MTVGHVPRKLSSICSLFIRRGGSISCRVTGSRRFSEDLPQGGLEIPCLLIFQGSMKDAMKAEKLVRSALSASDIAKPATRGESESPKPKRRKLTAFELCPNVEGLDGILKGARLSDQHIHQAQCLIKQQFPQLSGLRSTLYQSKCEQEASLNNQLQVIHSRGDHWIVSSTVDCEDAKVKVYDSVYSTVDEVTKQVILNLYHPRAAITVVNSQKQEGASDCGLQQLPLDLTPAISTSTKQP